MKIDTGESVLKEYCELKEEMRNYCQIKITVRKLEGNSKRKSTRK